MIFLELVPRDLAALVDEAGTILKKFPQLYGINVPDVLRISNRSTDAARALLEAKIDVLPHVRTIDQPLEKTVDQLEKLHHQGLKQVLLVSGDKPTSMEKETYPVSPVTVTKVLKRRVPELIVYCGLDPYRNSFSKELDYCAEKLAAGADGFFTQPFFDKELARIYLEQLRLTKVFIGASPVLSEKSMNYWKTKNFALFPDNFSLDLKQNCDLARSLIDLAESFGQHAYLMPITCPSDQYLSGIYGER